MKGRSKGQLAWRSAAAVAFLLVATGLACDGEEAAASAAPGAASEAASEAVEPELVGYDLRVIRPREERLSQAFDRMREEAQREGKRVAVLFSADWCHRCRRLEAELGNMHPAEEIGDVRILVLKEETWEGATRLDEFNNLRRRWEPVLGTYPLFVLLGPDGKLHEEMKDAIDRLGNEGLDATVENWFATSRASAL